MSFIKRIGFLSAFLITALFFIGMKAGGGYTYMGFLFAFFVLPALDLLVGKDSENVDEGSVSEESKKFYYRFITYLWAYIQVFVVIFSCYQVTQLNYNLFEWTGFILSLGTMTGGIGITVAHELGHKNTKIEQFYSKVLLMTVSYMHFFVEHNRGHHVHVATPKDPATAKYGESFYRFWPRTVFGSYFSAWKIENKRLRKKGLSPFSISNSMIWYTILPFVFCAALTTLFSFLSGTFQWAIPILFFSQSFVAITLLELVNYIEHYGITREEIEPGKYERVKPIHSWNANHLVSNFFLFQLQRHSDHHAFANRRYQVLRHWEESPQLPASYPTMIILALFPPLWFRVMNKKLDSWKEKYYSQKVA
ncbi:MAG: alkane 1-monooxygenase [Chitinophagaceae bacterium]|nr:MAG: alkane 1-monooxygenase [Chitinophagaceae bacterium]